MNSGKRKDALTRLSFPLRIKEGLAISIHLADDQKVVSIGNVPQL
jgi:hypothetical protein